MSGVVKFVKKVFKAVTKVVSKVLPIALAAGAIIFTAGAALGLAPLGIAGGWGGAVSSLTGALGLSGSSLGGALTGAITQAGYGAALGGIGGMITGSGFTQGAQMGALAGGLTGGVMGGLGMQTDPLSGVFRSGTPASGVPDVTSAGISQQGAVQSGAIQAAQNGVQNVAGAAPVAQQAAGSGIGAGVGSFIEKNGTMIGTALGGIGSGLMTGLAAKEKTEAEEKAAGRRTASYQGLPTHSAWQGDATARPTPSQAFKTPPFIKPKASPFGGGGYQFDPSTGMIVYVDNSD